MKNRRLLTLLVFLSLLVSVSCAGLRVESGTYVDIAYVPRVHYSTPTDPCEWVWTSTYWQTGWVCVPVPVRYRPVPVRPVVVPPPVVHRPRTAPPSIAVPRPTPPPPQHRGRSAAPPPPQTPPTPPPAGRGGRGQSMPPPVAVPRTPTKPPKDDSGWLGACDSPDPCPIKRKGIGIY